MEDITQTLTRIYKPIKPEGRQSLRTARTVPVQQKGDQRRLGSFQTLLNRH
jgi:hypothetical protein